MGKTKAKQAAKKFDLAAFVEQAFREGYDSYETPCCAYNSADSAWLASETREELLAYLEKTKATP